jgi:hypothetical protein
MRRRSPARKLEPTAAYRLGVDKGGGWRSPRKVTGRDNPQCPTDLPKILAYRWLIPSGPVGEFPVLKMDVYFL